MTSIGFARIRVLRPILMFGVLKSQYSDISFFFLSDTQNTSVSLSVISSYL